MAKYIEPEDLTHEYYKKLAQRAVDCRMWCWLPGMLANNGLRVSELDEYGDSIGYVKSINTLFGRGEEILPELTDPSTYGCLVALARGAWGPNMHTHASSGWHISGAYKNGKSINLGITARTEIEALVAALEAAE
jgi:hypothetical protein